MFRKKQADQYEGFNIKNYPQLKKNGNSVDDSFVMEGPFKLNIFSDSSRLIINRNVLFRSFSNILLYANSELIIHDNVFFNNYCSVNCLGKIEIGENCLFGEGVKIYDHNHIHRTVKQQLIVERNQFNIGSISIGKNCWIGSNVTILKNVEIGENTIIGANCLIYKSIPPNSIVKSDASLSIDKRQYE